MLSAHVLIKKLLTVVMLSAHVLGK